MLEECQNIVSGITIQYYILFNKIANWKYNIKRVYNYIVLNYALQYLRSEILYKIYFNVKRWIL